MIKLSNEQLEQLVSETREPLESLPKPHGFAYSENWVAINSGPWCSHRLIIQSWRWEAKPWLTNDNCTMRLFDETPFFVLTKALIKYDAVIENPMNKKARYTSSGYDRRRAIVEAWLKWKGKIC